MEPEKYFKAVRRFCHPLRSTKADKGRQEIVLICHADIGAANTLTLTGKR